MAERLALCDLGARAGGSSGFRTVLCCFFYSRISIMAMFVFGTPFFYCFRHTNTMDDTMLSPFFQL